MSAPAKDLTPLVRPRSIALVGATPAGEQQAGFVGAGQSAQARCSRRSLPGQPPLRHAGRAALLSRFGVPTSNSRSGAGAGARSSRHRCSPPGRGTRQQGRHLVQQRVRRRRPGRVAARLGVEGIPERLHPWRCADPTPTASSTASTGSPPGFPPYAMADELPAGSLGVVSQSGALVSSLVQHLLGNGLGLTVGFAVGNGIDLNRGRLRPVLGHRRSHRADRGVCRGAARRRPVLRGG